MGYQLFSDMTADVSEALMRGMPEVAYVPMRSSWAERASPTAPAAA